MIYTGEQCVAVFHAIAKVDIKINCHAGYGKNLILWLKVDKTALLKCEPHYKHT